MWLRLAPGLFRGVEGAIEDLYAALGIRLIAIGSVWSESRADFLDVVRSRRLAFEIPSSKLDAHASFPFSPLAGSQHLSSTPYNSGMYGLSLTTRPSTSTQA